MNHYNFFKQLTVNNDFFKPMVALSNGNSSEKLFDIFQSYTPLILPSSKENELRAYIFALIDLGIYLDVNEFDQNARNLFNIYKERLESLEKEYVASGKSLCLEDTNTSNGWTWPLNMPFGGEK